MNIISAVVAYEADFLKFEKRTIEDTVTSAVQPKQRQPSKLKMKDLPDIALCFAVFGKDFYKFEK